MTQALRFLREMEEIWNEDPHNLYDQWHNARKRAERVHDAERLYGNKTGDEPGYHYEFPDGSKAWINTSGHACRIVGKKGRPRSAEA